jgi:hypothetical protein
MQRLMRESKWFFMGWESTGWPLERASAEEVEVEMGDRFAGVLAVVEDESVSGVGDALATGDFGGGEEEIAEDCLIFGSGETYARDRLPGDDEDVDGGLGRDVAESEAEVILEEDLGGDIAVADFLEEGFGAHGVGNQ